VGFETTKRKDIYMFKQRNFSSILVMAAVLTIFILAPIAKALAEDSSSPPMKDNSSAGQMNSPSSNTKAMSSMKNMSHTGKLDGETFMGKMTDPTDSTKTYDETISFHNGMFHSAACDAYGYGEASYMTKKSYGKTTFSTETMSNKDGHKNELKWHGTIKGNELYATAQMMQDGKLTGTSTVKAHLETPQTTKMNY
jgi:hypothetical protein